MSYRYFLMALRIPNREIGDANICWEKNRTRKLKIVAIILIFPNILYPVELKIFHTYHVLISLKLAPLNCALHILGGSWPDSLMGHTANPEAGGFTGNFFSSTMRCPILKGCRPSTLKIPVERSGKDYTTQQQIPNTRGEATMQNYLSIKLFMEVIS